MADQSFAAADSAAATRRPSASVALASYNGAAFISAQIESILAQSELPDEIVVTDDQSTDDTLGIVAEIARRSPVPIRLHGNPERLGYARNFGRAAGLCQSDLIFFCDQDDLWESTKVERMKQAFADPAVYLAYHDALVVDLDNKPLHRLYDAGRQHDLLAVKPIAPWYASYGLTQAIRSPLREHDDLWHRVPNHIDRENELLPHDAWYFLLAQIYGTIAYVDEPLVRYRQHGANAVGASAMGGASGLGQRLRQQLNHDPRIDRLQSAAAQRRAEILDVIAGRAEGLVTERARTAARCYTSLAERLQRRYGAYRSPSLGQRAAMLARMLGESDYGQRPWRFRKLSILRDAMRGVVLHEQGSEAQTPAP